MQQSHLGIKELFSIWVHPYKTMQKVTHLNPMLYFKSLTFIHGLTMLLAFSGALGIGQSLSVIPFLILSLLLALPVGWIHISVVSFITFIVGKCLLRGSGSYRRVRAAFTFSQLPNIFLLVVWLISLILERPFISDTATPSSPGVAAVFIAISLYFIIGLFSFVIFMQGLRAAQGFSWGKAVLNLVLNIVLVSLVTFLIMYLLGSFPST